MAAIVSNEDGTVVEARDTPGIDPASVCPACGAVLVPRGARLWCDRCRLPVETCCDGGRVGGAVPDTRSIDDEVS